MEKYFLLFAAAIIFIACSKKEEKFELFSAEAFTYSMDNGWELNASCRVKGFKQNETENIFKAKLSYTIDLKTPDGKILELIDEGLIDKTSEERMTDLQIESQIQIDSAFAKGKYQVIFNISDDLAGVSITTQKDFELE